MDKLLITFGFKFFEELGFLCKKNQPEPMWGGGRGSMKPRFLYV